MYIVLSLVVLKHHADINNPITHKLHVVHYSICYIIVDGTHYVYVFCNLVFKQYRIKMACILKLHYSIILHWRYMYIRKVKPFENLFLTLLHIFHFIQKVFNCCNSSQMPLFIKNMLTSIFHVEL